VNKSANTLVEAKGSQSVAGHKNEADRKEKYCLSVTLPLPKFSITSQVITMLTFF